MFKKLLLGFVAIILLNISCYAYVDSDSDGYWDLSTPEDIQALVYWDFGWFDKFELKNDIDMTGHLLPYPIGYKINGIENDFWSTFDGRGFKIKNIRFESGLENENLIGIFSVNKGVIHNLTIEDAFVEGLDTIGGLVASNRTGEIENCKFSGTVKGRNVVGGLVGLNRGILRESSTKGEVEGTDYVGGLIGLNRNIEGYWNIRLSSSTCRVKGSTYVGGLIGYAYETNISECYYRGNEYCDNISQPTVIGVNYVGGLVGYFFAITNGQNSKNIENCYSLGNISGTTCGGIAGHIGCGGIKNCYSACKIQVLGTTPEPNGSFIGSEVGCTINFFNNHSYYNSENTPLLPIANSLNDYTTYLQGKTQSELKTLTTYDASWLINDPTGVWMKDMSGSNPKINDGYPYLKNLPSPEIFTDEDWQPHDYDHDGYYSITNICELKWVDEHPHCWVWNFKLNFPNNELDCNNKTSSWNTNQGFLPIGQYTHQENHIFEGNFDGNNNTIKNLVIKPYSHATGFIGCAKNFSSTSVQVIKNLILDGITIDCGSVPVQWVGGIVGHFYRPYSNQPYEKNKITGCKVINATITTDNVLIDDFLYVGGLLGGGNNGAEIMDCSVEGTTTLGINGTNISGKGTIGGLFGGMNNRAVIKSCHVNNVNISGSGAIGGLAGYSKVSLIQKCYTKDCFITTNADSSMGGFIGICDAETSLQYKCQIDQCFSNNNISYTDGDFQGNKVGGFIGSLAPKVTAFEGTLSSANNRYVNIENCYSRGTINTPLGHYVGGFIGRVNKGCDGPTNSYISTSYSACYVLGDSFVGGFIGEISSYTPNQIRCFWDCQIGPSTTAGDALDRSTIAMKQQITFDNDWHQGTGPWWEFGHTGIIAIWGMPTEGYPFLADFNFLQGKISILNPYSLSDSKISVFPNPVLNLSTLEINVQNEDLIDLSLYSILGAKILTVFSGKATKGDNYFSLDASPLNSGTYYVVLKTSNDMISKTVVINK